MPKKLNKKKPPKDINQLATYIVKQSTTESEKSPKSHNDPKNYIDKTAG